MIQVNTDTKGSKICKKHTKLGDIVAWSVNVCKGMSDCLLDTTCMTSGQQCNYGLDFGIPTCYILCNLGSMEWQGSCQDIAS